MITQHNNNKAHVVIVDAYSTGSMLARHWHEFRPILHIHSSQSMPDAFVRTAPKDIFVDEFQYTGDWSALISWLQKFDIEHIICGSEFGVILTDQLTEHFELRGNSSRLSIARRDKHQMALAIQSCQVPSATSVMVNSVQQASEEYEHHQMKKVVVKPLDSAGSEDVYVCHQSSEVAAAATVILGKKNLMQCENHGLLVQEFLEGTEFIINSVSANGHHYITDIWQSYKGQGPKDRIIYAYEELIEGDSQTSLLISDYVKQVLDALEIKWGPAHTELIMTKQGPILLETGARVSGLANPDALTQATGNNQVALSTTAFINPEQIAKLAAKRYQKKQSALCINLIAPFDGYINLEQLKTELSQLPSFQSLKYRRPTTEVKQTVDLNSSPAAVFLVHPDDRQVKQDYDLIRKLEQTIYSQRS